MAAQVQSECCQDRLLLIGSGPRLWRGGGGARLLLANAAEPLVGGLFGGGASEVGPDFGASATQDSA